MRSVFLIELVSEQAPQDTRRFFSLFDASKPFADTHWINLQPFVLRIALPFAIRDGAQLDAEATTRMMESLTVEEDASAALAAQWQFVRMELRAESLTQLDAQWLSQRLRVELGAFFCEAPKDMDPQHSPSGRAWSGVCPSAADFEWIFSRMESLTLQADTANTSHSNTPRRPSRL